MQLYDNLKEFVDTFTDEERKMFKDWIGAQSPHIREGNVIMGEAYDMMLTGFVAALRIAAEE